MDSLQSSMGLTSLVCTILNFQLAMALTVESVADGNTDMAAVNAVIDTAYLGLMGALHGPLPTAFSSTSLSTRRGGRSSRDGGSRRS
jgi:hypothetical protein